MLDKYDLIPASCVIVALGISLLGIFLTITAIYN